MAIYHLLVRPVRRAVGNSATATAARRSATAIEDHRTGLTFDFRNKQHPVYAEIVVPRRLCQHDVQWATVRADLWNAAERAERQKNSRVAREYELALPHELEHSQRVDLARAFSVLLADRYGCAVDLTIHGASEAGDQRNHYAMLLTTTREVTAAGLGAKTPVELSDTDRKTRGFLSAAKELVHVREQWALFVNLALEKAGHAARVDHRKLTVQRQEAIERGDEALAAELDRIPTKHLGVTATAMERRGKSTELGENNRQVTELAQLNKERRALDLQINHLTDLVTVLHQEAELARSALSAEEARGPR